MKEQGQAGRIASCILPAIVFSLVFELAAAALELCRGAVLARGSGAVFAWMIRNPADGTAFRTALSLGIAGLALLRTSRAEDRAYRLAATPVSRHGEPAALLVLAVTLSLGINLALSLAGVTGGSADTGRVSPVPGLLVYGVLSPMVEELAFRGCLIPRCERLRQSLPAPVHRGIRLRSLIPVALSSLLFALYHGNLPQGIYAFMMGLVLGAAYERTHRLEVCVCMHAAANIVSLVLSATGLYAPLVSPGGIAAAFTAAGCCVLFLAERRTHK